MITLDLGPTIRHSKVVRPDRRGRRVQFLTSKNLGEKSRFGTKRCARKTFVTIEPGWLLRVPGNEFAPANGGLWMRWWHLPPLPRHDEGDVKFTPLTLLPAFGQSVPVPLVASTSWMQAFGSLSSCHSACLRRNPSIHPPLVGDSKVLTDSSINAI